MLLWILGCLYLFKLVFTFSQYMPTTRIAGIICSTVFSDFLTIFHSGWTNLHYNQQYRRVPFLLHPVQHLFLDFFIMAILTDMNWYVIVVFISISLEISDEHLSMCLLAICMSSLEKCLLRSYLSFLLDFFWY